MTDLEFAQVLNSGGKVMLAGRVAYVIDHYTDNEGNTIAVVSKNASSGGIAHGNNVPIAKLEAVKDA